MAFVDRLQMRDPFFEVRIGPPGAQPGEMVKLSAEDHALIRSFEYTEAVDGGNGSASRIKLIFVEDENRPGSVLDLTITKAGKIKFLDKQTVLNGKAAEENVAALERSLSELKSKKVNADKQRNLEEEIAKEKKEAAAAVPLFLIQERNTLEVTWGYRSSRGEAKLDKLVPRTVRGEMLQIVQRASAGNIPLTEITAVDVGSGEMSKLFPREGITFTRKKANELLSKHGGLVDTSDRKDDAPARIDDIMRAIALGGLIENAIVEIDVSEDELKLDIQDDTSARTWAQGMNLHDFLKSLAEKIHAHYYVTTETSGGKTSVVLHLISRRSHEGENKYHFMWKSGLGSTGTDAYGGSSLVFNTMLRYDMALYPGKGSGGSSSGVCSKTKEEVGHTASVDLKFSVGHESRTGYLKLPVVKNKKMAADNNAVGAPVYSAACGNEEHEANANRLAGRLSKNLKLTFTTIGIPQLKPQVVRVSNIGNRYSGLYYLLAVTHKIDATGGYTCACTGESNAVRSGGVDAGLPPVKEKAGGTKKIRYRAKEGEEPDYLKKQLS